MDPERALVRISRLIAIVAAGGALCTFVGWGWQGGTAFALGAAAGYANFRWIKGAVDALGDATRKERKRWWVAVIFGLRYGILGAGAYVILKYSSLSIAAALTGLFVPVAAVVLEILYELVYASAS
jgi:ATP synthase I chain